MTTSLMGKKWRWRWCILLADQLLCFKQPTDDVPEDTTSLHGSFLLQDTDSPLDAKFGNLLFRIEDSGGNIKVFAAPSSADLKDWMEKIQQLLHSHNLKTQTFGAPLEQLLREPNCNGKVPLVVETLLRFLTHTAMRSHDIWSPPPLDEIQSTSKRWINGHFDKPGIEHEASLQVALLRKFLADLPEPVLTYALYQEFIEVARVRDAQRRTNDVKLVISSLPAANQMLLFALAEFLHLATSWSHGELDENALKYFAPVLLRPPLESASKPRAPTAAVGVYDPSRLSQQELTACHVLSTIVTGFEQIWDVGDLDDEEL